MEVLKKQVARAQRRLILQKFLWTLSWSLFATLLVAAALIAANKYWPQPGILDWHLAAGGAGLGLVVAGIWTAATRKPALDAAIELDKRFGLKERVSSTLSLGPTDLESEAGRALTADAVKRVQQIHVPERFKLSLNRWSWLPLAPAAAAFFLAVFLQPQSGATTAEAKADTEAVKKQVKVSSEQLRKQLVERRKDAREKGLKDAENLFEKLERSTKELVKGETDRKQSLVELNDLAKDIEKRKAQLGDGEKVKQQLNQLKDMKKGPADKLSDALKNGDLAQASKELEQLKEQIKNGQINKEAQKQLAEQMAQMQNKLQKMAEDQKKKEQDLKERIQQKKEAGKNAEAQELEKQLQGMQAQAQQMKKVQDLAEKMGQCAECMKNENAKPEDVQASLESLKADLNALQKELDEMQMLDEAMDEIAEAKEGLNGMGRGKDGMPGDGLGEGRGQGDRPEERTDVKFHESNVKQKNQKGAGIVTGFTDGPNIKGQVQQEIKLQVESAKTEASDPLTGQRLPREYRDHAKKYFDALREGKPQPPAPAGEPEKK